MANFRIGSAAPTASHGSTMSGRTILTRTLGPSLNALDIFLQLVKDTRRLSLAMSCTSLVVELKKELILVISRLSESHHGGGIPSKTWDLAPARALVTA